jgi:GNAT superfamily N-acetyltransferase
MPVPELRLQRHDSDDARRMLDSLADIYVQEYAEPPYSASPAAFGREAFIERTTRQVTEDGFSLLTGHVDGEQAGYAFGYTHGRGRWWRGKSEPPPPEDLVQSPAFVVIELIVRHPFRGRGYSHQLLDELLADRSEPFATLCAHPEAFARDVYPRWGWQEVCKISHENGVAFDVLVKMLT